MQESLLNSDLVSAVIAFFVVLFPLILIHELGHFLAAKAAGITILEFGIGFPPRIRKLFTWRDTEFTLNWIPLGGFVRPLGEDMIRPLDAETVEKDRQEFISRQGQEPAPAPVSELDEAKARGIVAPKSVNEAKPLGRIMFMAAGALANFLLAFVLFAIVALMGIPQANGGTLGVLDVTSTSPFAQAGIKAGDVITDVNGEKFNNSSALMERYYASTEDLTLTVLHEGSTDPVKVIIPASVSKPAAASEQFVQVQGVVKDSPADQSGLQPGDLVTTFNGERISTADELKARTAEKAGTEVNITVLRADETVDIKLTPRANPPEGQGAMGIVIGQILKDAGAGLTYIEGPVQQAYVPQSLPDAISLSANRIASVISATVSIPSQVLSGARKAEDARPVSIIGMSQIGGMFIQESIQQKRIAPILDFIATISVALGFFNLLPIPALDGGRILFVLLEIVRGRPIAPEREGLVHLVGLALLLSLSVLIILNDVINPITNQIR